MLISAFDPTLSILLIFFSISNSWWNHSESKRYLDHNLEAENHDFAENEQNDRRRGADDVIRQSLPPSHSLLLVLLPEQRAELLSSRISANGKKEAMNEQIIRLSSIIENKFNSNSSISSRKTLSCVKNRHRKYQTSRFCTAAQRNIQPNGRQSKPDLFTKPDPNNTKTTRRCNHKCSRATTTTSFNRHRVFIKRVSITKPSSLLTKIISRRFSRRTSCQVNSCQFSRAKTCRTKATMRNSYRAAISGKCKLMLN